MRLTKKRAIEITIELWEWLAETGGFKEDWPRWDEYGVMHQYCPLCEYAKRSLNYATAPTERCRFCPLNKEVEHCGPAGFWGWVNARSLGDRKKYAALFLEQLRKL